MHGTQGCAPCEEAARAEGRGARARDNTHPAAAKTYGEGHPTPALSALTEPQEHGPPGRDTQSTQPLMDPRLPEHAVHALEEVP